MTTSINKSFEINQAIDTVWANLTNPSEIVTCVPGATLTEQIDEDNYKGQVELKFGPVKAAYDGKITFLERNAATKTMSLKGLGLDSKGKGSAEMGMNATLTPTADGTSVNATMDITITGMLAQFGSRLINDVSNQVFDQFVNNFKAKLSGGEVDSQIHAGSMIGSMVKGLFK
jgi:uncharacterized protein